MNQFVLRIALLFLLCSCGLSAATVSWTGNAGTGDWSTPGNWTGGSGVPTSSDTAAFTGTPTVTIDTSAATAAAVTGSALFTIPAAGTLTVSGPLSAGTITLNGGTLASATVSGTIVVTSLEGYLNGVTIASGAILDLAQATSTVFISAGLTVNGSVHMGNSAGTTIGRVYFIGTQQWGGSGDILFGASTSNFISEDDSGGSTLTLAYPLTIHGQAGVFSFSSNSTVVNQAAIVCDATGGSMSMSFGTLVNQGSISGQGNGTTINMTATTWTNTGTIAISGGGTLSLSGSGTGLNAGLISDSAATLTVTGGAGSWSTVGAGSVNVSGGTLSLGGNWSAASGAITTSGTVSAPSTVNLGGTFTTAQGMLVGYTVGATTVNITGTMNNSAGLTLSSATGPWNLAGGSILGGTITGSGSNTLVGTTSGGTLNAVTIATGTILDLTQKYNVQCTITGGLTVNGSIYVGSSSGIFRGILYWSGTQQWGGTGDILFGGSNADLIYENDGGTQTLTLLSPLLIHGPGGVIEGGGTLINQSTIECTSPGQLNIYEGTLTNTATGSIISQGLGTVVDFTTTNWNNAGLIEATGTASLTISATNTGTNTGSITSSGGILTITGGTWSSTGAQSVLANGGTVNLGGAWSAAAGVLVTTGTQTVPMILNLGGTFTTAQALLVGYTLGSTTVNISGTMTNTPSLVLGTVTGPWTLTTGTISGGSITSTSANPLILGTSGTLAGGVTLTSGSIIDGTQVSGANCVITGGLTDNGTIWLGSISGSTYGRLYWSGTQTWSGSGSILCGGSTNDGVYEDDSAQTLTFGLLFHGTDGTFSLANTSTLINLGTIESDVSNGQFQMYGNFTLTNTAPGTIIAGASSATGSAMTLNVGAWNNTGTMTVNAGNTLTINATSTGTNSGTLAAASGTFIIAGAGAWTSSTAMTISGSSVIELGGAFPTAQATGILAGCPVPATFVRITGTMNNAGGLVLNGSTGPWYLYGGTINGGSITTSNSDTLVLTTSGGTLENNVMLPAGSEIDGTQADGGYVTISNGLTINGTLLLGNPTTTAYCRMYWSGSQTIAGTGSILFGNSTNNGIYENDATMTLTNQVDIHGADGTISLSASSTLINQGTIQCDVAGGTFQLSGNFTLTNVTGATILSGANAVTGATVNLAVGGWSNAGTINADAGNSLNFATLSATSPGTNTGTLGTSSGTLSLTGAWASTPALAITGTSVVNLGGTFTTAQALAAVAGSPVPGTTVNLTGTMNNAGGLTLGSSTGPWYLSGGTVTGGSITTSGSDVLVLTALGGGLAGITLTTGSVVDGSQINGAYASVTLGMTVNGTIKLGSPTTSTYGRLFWSGTQVWAGNGSLIFGASTNDGIFESDAGVTLTNQTTFQGQYATFGTASTSILLNQGTIETNVANGSFDFNGGTVTNSTGGIIESLATGATCAFSVVALNNQGTFSLGSTAAENWTCNGAFTQTSTGMLNMLIGGTGAGAFDVFSITGTSSLAGGLTLTSISGYYPHQGDTFSLLTTSGSTTGTLNSVNASFSLTYPGTGVIAHALDTSAPTVVVSVPATTSALPIPFTVTFSEPVNPITSSSSYTVSGGTVATVSGGPVVYTVNVTPSSSQTTVSLAVNAGATTNLNNVNNLVSNTANTSYNVAPTVSISPNSGVVGSLPTFTITTSPAVSGLTSSGLSLQGATLAGISPSSGFSTTFTVTITANAGNIQLQVLAGAVSDSAGGVNLASAVASVTYNPTGQAVVWAGTTNNIWGTASNWVGGQVPGASSNVIIPFGATVLVNTTTATVGSIDLQGNVTVASGGSLVLQNSTGIITLNNGGNATDGILTLAGGTLENAVVDMGTGGSFIAGNSGGTLQGVTIGSGVTFDMTQTNGSYAYVTNSLTVNGTIAIGSPSTSSYAVLYWSGTQSWTGNGQIVLGLSTNNQIEASSGVALTLSSPLRVHGQNVYFTVSGATLNTGSTGGGLGGLATDSATSTITINGGTWANTGSISTVAGSSLTVTGSAWTNSGTITGSTTTYYLGGTFPSAAAIPFSSQNGNIINITGSMNLGDNNGILTSTSSPWYLDGGTLHGGTLSSSGITGSLIATSSGGSLQGVTIAANTVYDMSQNNGSYATVTSGLTVNGTVLIGASASTIYGVLYWGSGAQTWGGTGQIIFGESTNNSIECNGGTSLTIQTPLQIHGKQVTFNSSGGTLFTQSIPTGGGTYGLSTDAAGCALIFNGGTWANIGSINLFTGSTLTTEGSLSWTNTGAFTGSGSTLNLGGSYESAAAVSFSGVAGNTINITGTLDLSDNNGLLTSTAPWTLAGGTMKNGTLNSTGSGSLIAGSAGTLTNVVIGANTTFDMSQTTGCYTFVSGGLTVNGTVLIGSASNSNYATLYWTTSQTWGGTGQIIFGQSVNNTITIDGGTTLTIQTPLAIHGQQVTFGNSGGTLLTQSSPTSTAGLATDAAGSGLTINGGTWTNTGTISLAAGSTFTTEYNVTWSNTGTVTASNATIDLAGNFSSASALTFSGINGNLVNIQGSMANGTTALSSSTGPWYLDGGTITGGTITGSGTGQLIALNTTSYLSGVTLAGTLNLTTGTVTITNGMTLTNGIIDIGAATGTVYGSLQWTGTQAWSGTGQIVFGASTNNSLYGTSTGTLTIGTGISIHGVGMQFSGTSGALATQGPISTDSPSASLTVNVATWTNTGTITTTNGGTITMTGAGTWSNTGTVTGSNTIFALGANYQVASAETFNGLNGNTVNITGNLTNNNGIVLNSSTGPWHLSGGVIIGGSITGSGANTLIATPSGGTLNGTTITAGTVFDLSQYSSAVCAIVNGISVAGTMQIGSATNSNAATVNWSGNQTWSGSGTGQIQFGQSTSNYISSGSTASTLTLASSLLVHGVFGRFSDPYGNCTLINQGTLQSDVAGGGLAITMTNWSNQGIINIGAGSVQTWTCSGAFTQTSTGTLNLLVGGLGDSSKLATTRTVALGGTITLTPTGGYEPIQGNAFTVITSAASGVSGTFATTTGPFTLSYQTASVTATAVDTTTPTVVVSGAATFSRTSPIPFTLTFSEAVTAPTVSGLSVTNGSVSSIFGGPQVYTAEVAATLASGTNGTVSLKVNAGAAMNSGTILNSASNTFAVTYETPPTVAVTPVNNTVLSSAPTFQLTFSNQVTGLTASGLSITGASIVSVTPSPTTPTTSYSVTTSVSAAGSIVFQVLAGAAVDQAGNGNVVSASDTVSYDPNPPTIVSITPPNNSNLTTSPTFVVTFSESVKGLTTSELFLTGASFGTITPGPGVLTTSYTIPVVVSGSGTVEFTVMAQAVIDSLGGTNAVGASDTVTVTNSPPTLTSVAPTFGTTLGGTVVTLTGTNFETGATVIFGSAAATSVTTVSSTSITATTPAGTAGSVAVQITNPDTQSSTLPSGYLYVTPPSVTSVSPAQGIFTGGTPITITGTNFSGSAVTIGGVAATSVVVVNATSITAVTPAGTVGPAAVVVTNSNTLSGTLSNGFDYLAPPPTVTSLTPMVGPTAGGTAVTITGTQFLSGATVLFGSTAATSVVTVNSTTITAVSPAGTGVSSVTVTNPDTQSSTLPGAFTYVPPPTVTSVTPAQGAPSGGTPITITGTNFSGSTVMIGGVAATSVVVVSSTSITAVTPAGSAGPASVTVTNSNGQGGILANGFDYVAPPPTVVSLTPAFGPTAGGTSVTITGTQFVSGATVLFGSTAATSVVTVNSTTITATSPAGTGVVALTVTNPDTQSSTLPSAFTYNLPPTVISLSPVQGSPNGGTVITITGSNFSNVSSVLFASSAATSVSTVNSTTITATTPAGTPGLCSVTVINGDGQQSTLPSAYTYLTPTVAVTSTVAQTNSSTVVFTVTYAFAVSNLSASQLTVVNGTIGTITGGPLVFSVPVTPIANGPVDLTVNGNESTGTPPSNTQTVTYDTTPPSATLSVSANLPLQGTSTTLSVVFSEAVTGFTLSTVTVNNASASAFTAVSATTYTILLTPNPSAGASIQVIIPAGSCMDLAGNPSVAAALVIPVQSTTLSTSVVTPAVSVSPAFGGTFYTAICPGTWVGESQVQNFLAGKTDLQAVGYVWDATLQTYDQVPMQAPTGGWQPDQGVFLATRLATDFNFNGYMATVDYELTLKPGWNFVGIPPLDDNGVETVSHNWSDLRLEDTSGNLISGTLRVNLIDVGAWFYDGSSYSQDTGALTSGIGYWIENTSSPPVDLVLRRLSAAEIAGQAPILASANQQVRQVTIGYRPHGTPPPPPAMGSARNNDTATHGCGFGSGIGVMILSLSMVMVRLRLRSRGMGRLRA